MSPAPAYHFLSWVRDGLASAIDLQEDVDSTAGPAASRLTSTVTLNDQQVPAPDLAMIGPGDVAGFDRAQIVRLFPQQGVTDAEPTMFPLIEFDRPDLPWLATPRRAADDRLRPWICLVVVETGHPQVGFDRRAGVDLEVLTAPATELPDPQSLHLWAHAQLLLESTESLERGLTGDPRRTVSRLICPRLLNPLTAYRACVVPAFKATVSAILRETPRVDDLTPAWVSGEPIVRLPVLTSWTFATGEAGGFEELVDRLRGRPLPDGVGLRALDVSRNPGLKAAGDNAVTQIESALRAPGGSPAAWPANPAHEHFSDELVKRVTSGTAPAELDEPIVAPPLYGGIPWHHTTIKPGSAHWVDELNCDPRNRVTAALGTAVIQHEQEQLMERAWRQLADEQERERERQRAVFGRAVGGSLFSRHLERLGDDRAFALTIPAHGRLESADAGSTVAGAAQRSLLPNAADGMPFRRAFRQRGTIATRIKRLGRPSETFVGQLDAIAMTGLAVPYKTPDGILGLLEDPREVFGGQARERVVQVFADHGVENLEALSSSIGANAALAATGPEELSALDIPKDFGADLQVARVPQIAHARFRVEQGGLAEQLVAEGFALKLSDDSVFAAPKDDAGQFVPVGIELGKIRMLSQIPEHGITQEIPFEVPDGGPAIDALLAPTNSLTIAGDHGLDQAVAELRPARGFGVLALGKQDVQLQQHQEQGQETHVGPNWTGAAVHSIGELSLSPEIIARVPRIDRGGLGEALLEWGRDQEVSLVAAPGATLGSFSAIVDIPPAAVAGGLIAGLAKLPDVEAPVRGPFAIADNVGAARASVKPDIAIGRYIRSRLGIDPSLVLEAPLWTPTFRDAMWKPLSTISNDWLLAGLDKIPPNTVTLAETNDRFIEAYLVGLNHEFGREMLWREFPTDRRGTPFQSFWGRSKAQPGPAPQERQQLPEIHKLEAQAWREGSLGTHKPDGPGDAQLVLMIRGDLLRRYPGTIVFAAPDKEGHADFGSTSVKEPIFDGALGDEYRFLGFDLDGETARRDNWWFVFAEQPTEPRFGFDTPTRADSGDVPDWGNPRPYKAPTLPGDPPRDVLEAAAWNDANWSNVVSSGQFAPGIHAPAKSDGLKLPLYAGSDRPLDPAVWGTHAADVARICFQQPVRASVSAREMLASRAPDDLTLDVLERLRSQQLLPFRRFDA